MPSPGPVLMPLFTPAQSDPWLTPAPKHLQPLPTRSHTPGLQNLGNTCFLNAALQCLLHTPFASLLIHSGPHANANPEQARFCAFCALQHLAKLIHRDSASRVIAPKAFASNPSLVCNTFRVGRQEDAHEFVRALLDRMTRAEVLGCDAARAGSAVVSWQREMQADVHKVFGGILESRVACRSCRHVSVTTEPFLDLSLEIARVGSVEAALERFTAEEILQGDNRYRCEGCRKLVVAAKRFSVRRAPNVLTLHLKRFDRNRKDGRFIQYPDVLDLAPFMIGRPKGMTAKYALTGVLIHQGTSRQYGHYYAYVKGTNKNWYLKDDSTSRTTSTPNALKQRAYLLFYTRIDANLTKSKPTGTKQQLTQPMDIIKPCPVFKVPALRLSKLQEEEEDEELVLSEESSSEDEDRPSPTADANAESDLEEEEVIKKEPRRKSTQTPDASRQRDKPITAAPPSPGKSSVSQGLAKRISEVRKKAAEVSPARKVLGPMARRMEGKAKQSNAEAAKKATESMKESDTVSRRFLGAGARSENKPSPSRPENKPSPSRSENKPSPSRSENKPLLSPDGEKSQAGRTVSEPSLVQRKILAPIRRLSSNSAERASEKSPEPARRKFLSLGRKTDPRTADSSTGSGESGDETEPSERNSSADDEEEAPAPNSVREVLISGGSAVRKVMHRVFGVAMLSPQSEKKKPSEATPPSTPQQQHQKSSPSPRVNPSEALSEAPLNERQERREPRPGTSALFGSEGVDRWNNDAAYADGEVRKSFTRSRIVKRRRANDILDAEYDRGKAKKARVRYHQAKLKNSFGVAMERRKNTELGNEAV